MDDILNNLQHPKVVEAFLLAPAFTSKLPSGVKLSLRHNVPITPKPGIDPSALEGEHYTWAVLATSEGKEEVASAAMVDTNLTDADLDALDTVTESGKFMSYVKDGAMHYRVGGEEEGGKEIGPGDAHYNMYNFALEGGALAHASGGALILSNGPRWLVVSAEKGLTFSRSFGQREDRSPVAADRPTTSMYGALVGNAFEHVITRAQQAQLVAEGKAQEGAKAAAAEKK